MPPPTSPAPETEGPARLFRLAAALAVIAQIVVAGFTYLLGLSFPGPIPYYIAVLQSLLALGVLAALLARRSRAAFLVPVASASLTLLLLWIGNQVAQATGCNETERSLAAELEPPPGVAVDLRGGPEDTCSARFTTDLSPDELIAHYRAEFETHGWQVITPGMFGGPGEGIAAVKNGIVVEAVAWSRHSGGVDGIFVYAMPPGLDTEACSAAETSAMTDLAAPLGAPNVAPWGEADAGCVSRFSISREVTPELATPAEVVDHYQEQFEASGWQVTERTVGADAGEITATDGAITLTVLAELYPEGVPRSQEPLELSITITAADDAGRAG